MTDRKTLILAQLLITLMLAVSMSGIMSMIAMGPTAEWLRAWPMQIVIAWPIALVLTQFVGRIAFGIAGRVMSRKQK